MIDRQLGAYADPTRTSGMIVLLKTPKKREFFPTLFVKKYIYFQLVFLSEQTRTVTTCGEHGIMAHNDG